MMNFGTDSVKKVMMGSKEVVRAFLDNRLVHWQIPSEYQRIEYIGANGNNWLATGITASIGDTEIEFEGDGFTNTSAQIMVARTTTSNNFRIAKFTATQKVGANCISQVTSTENGISRFTAVLNKNGFWINGTLVGTFTLPSTLPSFGEIDIFRGYYSGTSYYAVVGNARKAIVRKNGIIAFFGIPVRRKSDSELGLYDVVKGVFRTNQGSTSFVGGDDVE